MLIRIKTLSQTFSVNPTGVLHVGAHLAEELVDYNKFGWGFIHWVEVQPHLVEHLKNTLDLSANMVHQLAAWSISGLNLKFNVASNGQSSSLLDFGTHRQGYPSIEFIDSFQVQTKRLDEVFRNNEDFNFLNLDVQGAELEVLKGMGEILNNFEWVYTEVNRHEVYKNCATVIEIDQYLKTFGFIRVATRWVLGKGWGDALYVRNASTSDRLHNLLLSITWYFLELVKYPFRKYRNLGMKS